MSKKRERKHVMWLYAAILTVTAIQMCGCGALLVGAAGGAGADGSVFPASSVASWAWPKGARTIDRNIASRSAQILRFKKLIAANHPI